MKITLIALGPLGNTAGTWRNFILMMTVMILATVIALVTTCCLGWRAEKNRQA